METIKKMNIEEDCLQVQLQSDIHPQFINPFIFVTLLNYFGRKTSSALSLSLLYFIIIINIINGFSM